ARIEKNKFKNPLSEDEIYEYFKGFKRIIPQGSIMYGLGNHYKYVSLSNCYVIDICDSYAGICKADEELVHIAVRRGGSGLDISSLRPKDTPTKNAARTSTGIIPFMERFSNTIREVCMQGRRGALLQSINVHHPEIVSFINAKKDNTKVTGANISVRLTDEFLNAVDKDEEYEQRWPVDSDNPIISNKIKAKDVWNEIVKSAYSTAEPGLMFISNIEQNSPADCYANFGFKTTSSNPCCFSVDQDVMVITNNGIKELKNITSNDRIWINETQEFVKNSGYFNSGIADIYKVTFSNGESLELTSNHRLCRAKKKRIGTTLQYFEEENCTKVSNLKKNDYIMIQTTDCSNEIFHGKNTYEEGLILGWLTGDGCLTFNNDNEIYPYMALDFWKDDFDIIEPIQNSFKKFGYDYSVSRMKDWNYKRRIACYSFVQKWTEYTQENIWLFRSHDKSIPYLYKSSPEFIKGFISSYFSADGSITYSPINSNYAISLSSINKKRLHQISYILGSFGIKSYICKLKDECMTDFHDGHGPYKSSESWRLLITGIDNIRIFANNFDLYPTHKKTALQAICNLQENKKSKGSKYTKIKNIVYVGKKEVGCIDVDKYHKFTANNIISGNSELPLCPYDSCRLILLNLYSYVKTPFQNTAKFDYDLFFNDVQVAQRIIDDIVDLELECIDKILSKIDSDPENKDVKYRAKYLWNKIKEKCKQGRRTGTGITALGDCLAALNIEYGSEQSIKTVDNIYKALKFGAYQASIEMAKEIGSFPIFDKDLEKNNIYFDRMKKEELDLSTRTIYGHQLISDMETYGRRNIACLTTSPAGSVSILTQTTSGIEPVFQLKYTRRKKILGEGNADFVDKTGDK
ncbi:MAG: LAGLIDADG family homing endonuclease, partial [Candidatus Omnitrophica bacterium]|nr:LAGLIDADG family homing endonuclease [Candidatus Omnitrophota bacterium]